MDNQNTQNPNTTSAPNGFQPPVVPPQPVQNQVPNMQYPMSASQMGLNGPAKKSGFKKFSKPLVVVAILAILVSAGLLFMNSRSGYGTKTVQADGFSYSVNFDRNAITQTAQTVTYLTGKDSGSGNTMVLSIIKASGTDFDCFATDTIQILSKPSISGKEHNLCYSPNISVFSMNFTHNNEWYLLSMFPKTLGETLDPETAKTIAASIKMN